MYLKERKIAIWDERQRALRQTSFDDALELLGIGRRFLEREEKVKSRDKKAIVEVKK